MKAIIIGSGNIGSDYDDPKSEQILTHAHALKKNKDIEDFAFVDTNSDKLKLACDKWNVQGFSNLSEAIDSFSPELVCIATPPVGRLEIFKILNEKKIKKVICEKPLCLNLEEAKEILNLVNDNQIIVNINFPRRFDSSIVELKRKIENEDFGKACGARCVYTKGVMNSGSHMLNLLTYLFGPYQKGTVFSGINDYDEHDPTLNCVVNFSNNNNVQLMAVDCNDYFLFECDLLFEKARVRLDNRGFRMTLQERREDPIYPGYFDLAEEKIMTTNLDKALSMIVSETISGNIISSVVEAKETLSVCTDLIEKYKEI